MFGLGMPEVIIILMIALIIFGPRKLPELARSLGKFLNEFKKYTADINKEIKEGMDSVKVDIDLDIEKDLKIEEDEEETSKPKSKPKPKPQIKKKPEPTKTKVEE